MTKTGLGTASEKLTGLAILIAGKNTFGYTGDGTKAPEFEFELVDEDSTGLVKSPKFILEVENLSAIFVAHVAAELPFVLKGNLHKDGKNVPLLITVQGQLHKMSPEIKVGDKTKRTFEIRLNMYTELVDNIPAVVYTRQPYLCVLGGVDTAPDFNDNI